MGMPELYRQWPRRQRWQSPGLRKKIKKIQDFERKCLHKIGEDVSERLEFIPASLQVIEEVRPK
jgi:transposase